MFEIGMNRKRTMYLGQVWKMICNVMEDDFEKNRHSI